MFWNINILDPDTKEVVHVCTHTVYGKTKREAVKNFKSGYNMVSNWGIRAEKAKERRDP
jgi:hypothetical protein